MTSKRGNLALRKRTVKVENRHYHQAKNLHAENDKPRLDDSRLEEFIRSSLIAFSGDVQLTIPLIII